MAAPYVNSQVPLPSAFCDGRIHHYICTAMEYADRKPTTEESAAFQFAAKLNEGLVLLSLSSILFHHIRYRMLESGGVPLGLLSAPFQLNSPVYFISAEFFSVVRSAVSSCSLSSVALVVTAGSLAVAVGPFSAILLTPHYGLWELQISELLVPAIRGALSGTISSYDKTTSHVIPTLRRRRCFPHPLVQN